MKEDQIKEILLESIHKKTGWGNPLKPFCECENLYIQNITENSDGKLIVDFRYIFDEDGWSQYDKTHVFDGHVTIENGNVIELEMDNIHVGVAAIVKYNPKEI